MIFFKHKRTYFIIQKYLAKKLELYWFNYSTINGIWDLVLYMKYISFLTSCLYKIRSILVLSLVWSIEIVDKALIKKTVD